jgi:hypothetical protein
VVYLGDYVDRGPDSGRALDLLAANRTDEPNLRRIYLTGNHDQYLVDFIRPGGYIDMNFLAMWFANGGEQTLQSLGLREYGRLVNAGRLEELGGMTRAALGSSRVALLERLRLCHKAGDYLFVHAGIDPAVDLEVQDRSDLLMIREPFLSAARYWRHSFASYTAIPSPGRSSCPTASASTPAAIGRALSAPFRSSANACGFWVSQGSATISGRGYSVAPAFGSGASRRRSAKGPGWLRPPRPEACRACGRR